ncbi:MAG: NAD-binding protein [Candidatus Thorarchaeota archaeon]
MDNYRLGSEPEVEVETACKLEIKLILGFEEYIGKGTYKEIPENLEEFRDKRVLIVDSGDESLELAIKLTDYTGRVIVTTTSKEIPGREAIAKKLKHSDVKILRQSELIEIKGQLDEVEKVVLHDFDEDENYELFSDAVVYLDYRG